LLLELHLRAEGTLLARAQVGRLWLGAAEARRASRDRSAGSSATLPRAHPDPDAWRAVALSFGAV
jgi:hypothetical protein